MPSIDPIEELNENAKKMETMKSTQSNFLYGEKLQIKYVETKLEEMKNFQPPKIEMSQSHFPKEPSPGLEMNIRREKSKNRVFFAYYQIYIFIRYFLFVYERFEFAKNYSLQQTGNLELYEFFRKMLVLNIYGIIDNVNLEDSFRIIFGYNCGIFLNFERIFINLFKIYKSNKFCNSVISSNSHVFERNSTSEANEEVLFVQTAFLLNQSFKENQTKVSKNNALNNFH